MNRGAGRGASSSQASLSLSSLKVGRTSRTNAVPRSLSGSRGPSAARRASPSSGSRPCKRKSSVTTLLIDMARSTAGREVADTARRLEPSPPLSAAARAPRTVRGRRPKASLFEAAYFDRRRGARQAGGRRGSAGPDAVGPATATGRRASTASYFSGGARRSVTRTPRSTSSRHGMLRARPL